MLIPYGKQSIDKEDKKIVLNSLSQSIITGGGIYQKKLEISLTNYLNSKYAITCSSGTAAIHMALKAIGCKKGDKIIMPCINFISSYNISRILELDIYLADVDAATGQLTSKTIHNCVKKNNLKNIKAIIVMYLGGYTYNISEIYNLKKKFNCFLIEDACHAFGTSYIINKKKYKVGSCKHADISTFSMHPVKSITSAEGGILTTNNRLFFKKALGFKSHNLIKDSKKHWKYKIKEPGLNYRLSDINCALAYSQLKRISKFLSKRKEIYKRYKEAFSKINNKILNILEFSNNVNPSFHLFVIFIDFKKIKKKKDEFIRYLKKNNIFVQYHYIPIYKFDIYTKKNKTFINNFKGSETFYKKAISLPIYYDLNVKDQNKVITKIFEFIKL
tara:strand:+ start:953 stop:2116 length:1164 start_codon:yes stop_codon:yes gene_type:complete